MKVAGPTLILGGGAGGGKIPETFLYHKILISQEKILMWEFLQNHCLGMILVVSPLNMWVSLC
ncbi:hypothetical protein JWG45_17980 [Leptospira sp. 201903070]|uniref:Nucleotidyl transferase domain-containing protein n=1 Tax=Leptospira ainlahdjerensis TaxID=2810033 RepID=A0ABS2UF80_9LEPT|nr:hypothetical protein [Leptospira ainlahdjerensis]MBM9579040.1 hypothetical protein [Leptospira ainlahdjerensis]